jgi:predicted nucleotide-binding protein (sugar kinase/HSP70/actin superfamily)
MGNIYIALKAFFDEIGVQAVVPPLCSKKTLELGTRISPDSICLPLKLNLGNYIESMEKGADTFIITGSCGPCRFGYYGVSEKEILEDNGYPVDVVMLDPPSGAKRLYHSLRKATGGAKLTRVLPALKNALDIAQRVDALESRVWYIRPREKEKGAADTVYSRFRREAYAAEGMRGMRALITHTCKRLDEIPLNPAARPLKIGILGEIFTIIEPYTNLDIERKLGRMGFEVDRSLTASAWVADKLFYRAFGRYGSPEVYQAAKPYLDRCIGGHTWECAGNAVLYARNGFDGAIEVLPFGCMPEIVSKSILPRISADTRLPIMTLVVDEMTGEAGFDTRLQAFADLLQYRRKGGML